MARLGFIAESALTPLGQPVDPEEIAESVAYLAKTRSITGQMISVDSGQHIAWRTPDVVAISPASRARRSRAQPLSLKKP